MPRAVILGNSPFPSAALFREQPLFSPTFALQGNRQASSQGSNVQTLHFYTHCKGHNHCAEPAQGLLYGFAPKSVNREQSLLKCSSTMTAALHNIRVMPAAIFSQEAVSR